MKKTIISLLGISLLLTLPLIQSCSTNAEAPVNTATADAAAGFEAYVGLTEVTPVSCTPLGQGIILVVSGVMAADASGFFSKQTTGQYVNHPNLTTNTLPKQYLIETNPFEEVGIIHNKALNMIIERGGIDIVHQKLAEDDQETWEAFFSLSPTYQNEFAIAAGCGPGSRLSAHQSNITEITTSTTKEEMISLLAASQSTKDFLSDTHQIFDQMVADNKSNDDIYGYLNSKIISLLSKDKYRTEEDNAAIVFLTILKHSNYYWNGK